MRKGGNPVGQATLDVPLIIRGRNCGIGPLGGHGHLPEDLSVISIRKPRPLWRHRRQSVESRRPTRACPPPDTTFPTPRRQSLRTRAARRSGGAARRRRASPSACTASRHGDVRVAPPRGGLRPARKPTRRRDRRECSRASRSGRARSPLSWRQTQGFPEFHPRCRPRGRGSRAWRRARSPIARGNCLRR